MSQHSYLVRCSAELIDQLIEDDSDPVVIMRVTRHSDGSHELIMRTPDRTPDPTYAINAAVWRELNKRRWFGKYVDEEEMDTLEHDLRAAIEEARHVQ